MKNPTNKILVKDFSWVLFLLFAPGFSFALQPDKPDTTFVLKIEHFYLAKVALDEKRIWVPRDKFSYISAGANVELILEGGDSISKARIKLIGKDFIMIEGKQIPISSIAEINVINKPKSIVSTIFGLLLFSFGALVGGVWISLYLFCCGGEDPDGLFFAGLTIPLAIIISGMALIKGKNKQFNFRTPRLTLGTKPVSDLPRSIRKKLGRKFFI